MESMDGVTLVSHESVNTNPVVQDLRSELDAAWEEHAAKRSRKTSPDKPKSKPTGKLFFSLVSVLSKWLHHAIRELCLHL